MLARCLEHSQRILSRKSNVPSLYLGRKHISPQRFISSSPGPIGKGKYAWSRGIGFVAFAGATIYVFDRQFNASSIGRNLRTLYTGALVAVDYKMNFKPGHMDNITALHERVAERLYNLLVENGGLYIKIGQALAANTAVLPAPFQSRFSKLFDDAPQVPYADIERVFIAELGKPPTGEDGIFEEFEERAVASASVAQVHRAKLKGPAGANDPGRWVAVKVQKPDVSMQVEWDLAAYRAIMWMYENWFFDLPVYFLVDFISSHLRLELDFLNEARNAQRTAALIASEPQLAGKVYVPKVYDEFTTGKVMTAEYIDGVKLSDRRAIRRLLDGASTSSSAHGPDPDPAAIPNWDGSASPSYSSKPLRGGARSIMETLVSLFSVQIFQWGFVHCDPHPGNIIIRRRVPSNEPQLVLIDHGLYVTMPDDLRRDYARLWKGLLGGDMKEVREVAHGWGIGKESLDLLASGVLLKPWRSTERRNNGAGKKELDPYEKSLIMKEKLRQFLTDTERFPKALVFLGRNMRMVQGNNQALGSPVNRVKVIGHWASRSLATAANLSLSQRLREYWHHATYVIVIFALDVAFWLSKVRRWARGGSGVSFEDELEQEMRRFSKENLGIELDENAFLA
ncbi:atypical/ABC1/ABC1-B protein kinase [Gautieria morchelliformis]|nr:atypical/ABC1/ABC1-B protein kinase [Gautieria morchelliformis]